MAVRGVSAGERAEQFVSELDPCPAPAVAVVVAAGHVDPRGGDTKEAARETKVSSCASLPDGEETSGEYPAAFLGFGLNWGAAESLPGKLFDVGAGRGCWRAALGSPAWRLGHGVG